MPIGGPEGKISPAAREPLAQVAFGDKRGDGWQGA
jgi:hypothetical protein